MDALQREDVPYGNDWDSAEEVAAWAEEADRIRPNCSWAFCDRRENGSLRGDFRIRMVFNDGLEETIDFLNWLEGPIFEPLLLPPCGDFATRMSFTMTGLVSCLTVTEQRLDFLPLAVRCFQHQVCSSDRNEKASD